MEAATEKWLTSWATLLKSTQAARGQVSPVVQSEPS